MTDARDSGCARILLVDGLGDMQEFVPLLQKYYSVQIAESGDQALEIARTRPPDLILADLSTPVLEGFGLLKKIRLSTNTAYLPVILVADPPGPDAAVETLGAGAEDYIIKPFTERELVTRVDAQLKMSSIRLQAEEALRASEVRYRRLFEAAHDGILILDADTLRITDVNPFLIELLGYPRHYFLDKELWEIGIFHDKDESIRVIEEVRKKGAGRYDNLPLQVRSGRQHPVEVVANIYCEDRQLVIQCNIRDIRERVKLEFEREALLGREQASRQQAEAANQMKDIFLATLSHELRTPLNAIIGWSGILREPDLPAEEFSTGLEVIERNAKMQAQLIEDLLDVSSIVSGKLRLEIAPCELEAIIRAVIETVRPAMFAKDIEIVTEFDSSASLGLYDEPRMQQVVWNLLSNAIKFTPPGGRVIVRLSRRDNTVVIQVSDTGVGMSPDFLPYVFDRFRQADTGPRRRKGGLGLGLSIVRHIVEMHGGRVKAHSEGEDKGSTFTVELPVHGLHNDGAAQVDHGSADRQEPTPESTASHINLGGLRVLVVDDEPDTVNLLVKVLESAGAEVSTATSAAEAMEVLKATNPDVLVSDIAMPNEDGYDLIRKIRRSGRNAKKLPAVAVSAFAGKEQEKRALLAGYQMHVAKPIDPQHLIVIIASLAGQTV